MPTAPVPAAAFLALLSGLSAALPASAQVTYAPEPSAPLTAKDITVRPPVLPMYSLGGNADMNFLDKEGTLVLTLSPTWWANKKPEDKVLWSGKIGVASQKFSLVTTQSEQDLKDDTGKTLWSEKFDEPSLTLDFDQPGHARLFDSAGKELTGQTEGIPSPLWTLDQAKALFKLSPFAVSFGMFGGVMIERDRRQTTIYSDKHFVWSGPTPANKGVRLGRSLNSQIVEIPAPLYPVGQTTTFEVTKETGSINVADKDHHLLKTIPSETLRLMALTTDKAFRKSGRSFFLLQPHVATTQPAPIHGGLLYAQYQTADGTWFADEKVDAVETKQRLSGPQETLTGMELHIENFDQAGKLTRETTIGYPTSSQPSDSE